MKGFTLGLSISLAFILGCVSAPLIIPRLSAQNPPNTTRWEYVCENFSGRFGALSSQQEFLNEHGSEGWELVTTEPYACLKRPLM
jgi:hypothetical protein